MVKGRCECDAVSFEIDGSLSAPTLCHCGMCRRWHGAPGAYTGAPRSAYRIAGEENLNWFRSSTDAERGFCRICGSKLFWRELGGTNLDVTMGSLEPPTGFTLGAHIWARHQGDYYEIDHDGVPHFAESSAGQQPIAEEPAPARQTEPAVHHGSCQCGAGVFKVAGRMRDVVVCHCGQCRRIHGHAPGYSAARRSELQIERGDRLAWYRSSETAQRGFCSDCGSSLFWKSDQGDTISIPAGSLHPPTGLRTARHIFVADKSDYYRLADGVPQNSGTMADDPVAF
ncbi:MAG TPA: GFA family protein [Candidatus Cybelea sp.]|nr:GFA family protein [Candidatus Cybelea sp.]